MGKKLIKNSIFLIGITVLLYIFYAYEQKILIQEARLHLLQVAEQQKKNIVGYFEEHQKQVLAVAQNAETLKALKKLSNVTNTIQESKNGSKTAELHEDFKKTIENNFPITQYDQLFLTDRHGTIVWGYNQTAELGTNLVTGSYKDTAFGRSFARVIMVLAPDISDTAYYVPAKKAALFISVPIFEKTVLQGVLTAQLNFQDIFTLISDYKKLGKTGEIILTKKSENDVIFVSNLRHGLYRESEEREQQVSTVLLLLEKAVQGQKVPSAYNQSVALYKAAVGIESDEISINNRSEPVVAISRYLPQPSWGLVIQMNVDEILQPTKILKHLLMILLTVISILLLCILVWILQIYTRSTMYRIILSICLGIFFCLLGYLFYRYRTLTVAIVDREKTEAHIKLLSGVQQIENKIKNIHFLANNLASDLTTGRIARDDLALALKREVKENPEITALVFAYKPYEFDTKTELYAPYAVRKNSIIEQINLADLFNYTVVAPAIPQRNQWYIDAFAHNGIWIQDYKEPVTQTNTLVYAVPFYNSANKKKQIGVVAVMYNLDHIRTMISTLTLGKTSYAFLLSTNQKFIYHPVTEYVQAGKTLEQLANETSDIHLQTLATELSKDTHGISSAYNAKEGTRSWIYYTQIPMVKWTLATIFNEADVVLPISELINYLLKIYIIAVLCCLAFVFFLLNFKNIPLGLYSSIVAVILSGALLVLWICITHDFFLPAAQEFIITDKLAVNQFLDQLRQNAEKAHKKMPFILPTGISINFLGSTNPDVVSFLGYVWQKYDQTEHKDLARAIQFPQASKSTITQIYRQQQGTSEIVGWAVNCELVQTGDYAYYPFDVKKVTVMIEHPELIKSVVLIPDSDSYPTMKPYDLPGLNHEANLRGFYKRRSYFNYRNPLGSVTFGAQKTSRALLNPSLTFNIILKRDLLNAFVIYLLPLFVILVAIFATMLALGKEQQADLTKSPSLLKTLSALTALFFSLVLLHRGLRGEFQVGQIIYLEYLFFFTYLTLLGVQMYSMLMPAQGIKVKIGRQEAEVFKLLYWPMQAGFWFIITLIIFYRY